MSEKTAWRLELEEWFDPNILWDPLRRDEILDNLEIIVDWTLASITRTPSEVAFALDALRLLRNPDLGPHGG